MTKKHVNWIIAAPEEMAPVVAEARVCPGAKKRARIVLGLDLGTSCGYCFSVWLPDGKKTKMQSILPEHMGQWDLSAGPYDSGAIRFVRLRRFLAEVRPDLVAYEDVKNTPAGMGGSSLAQLLARSSTAAELLATFRGTVATWCEEQDIPCTGFPIGVLKKRATGKGNASKADMIEACNTLFGSNFDIEGYEQTGVDNVADAAFVNLMALEQYADGLS